GGDGGHGPQSFDEASEHEAVSIFQPAGAERCGASATGGSALILLLPWRNAAKLGSCKPNDAHRYFIPGRQTRHQICATLEDGCTDRVVITVDAGAADEASFISSRIVSGL